MDPRNLRQEASDLLARGKFAQAEVLYRQMLLLHPRDAQLWVRHAEALKRLGRGEDAVAAYRQAARMLSEAGHFSRSVAALRLALELRPQDLDLISELIRTELRKAHFDHRAAPHPAARLHTPAARLALPVLEEAVTNPGITIEVLERAEDWPQVRRLSGRAIALKSGPAARWMVIESASELRVSFADKLVESDDDDEYS